MGTIDFYKEKVTMSSDDFGQTQDAREGTVPISAGSIRKGMYVMLKGKPCKVTDYSTAKVGKHGSAKAKVIGVSIFDDTKNEEICPTSHNMLQPVVTRTTYQFMGLSATDTDYAMLYNHEMSTGGDPLRQDVKMPTDDSTKVANMVEAVDAGKYVSVVIISAVGEEKILTSEVKITDSN